MEFNLNESVINLYLKSRQTCKDLWVCKLICTLLGYIHIGGKYSKFSRALVNDMIHGNLMVGGNLMFDGNLMIDINLMFHGNSMLMVI